MILENGVVRTMDPSLPVARALAIAGDHVAGGVGTHEMALPDARHRRSWRPLRRPGSPTRTSTSPTWSLARRDVRLEGVSVLADAPPSACLHPATARGPGDWLAIRGVGPAADEGGSRHRDGAAPAALFSKDYHSLWLNSAALALADGDLQVEGGVVERDASGEPTGILREESAWQFRARFASAPEDDSLVHATREGLKVAASRGVVAIHDSDGRARRASHLPADRRAGRLTLRVWQSILYERLPELEAVTLRSGIVTTSSASAT